MTKLEKLIEELCPDGVEYVEVGKFARVEKGKNKNRKCNLAYSITKSGLLPTDEYFKGAKVTSDDTSGYRIVKKNWFVYSPSRIDVGSINYLHDDIEVIVSPLNVVFSIDESVILPSYLLYYLSSRDGTWQIISSREGIEGTGRKLLPFEKFAKIIVPVPPLVIQQEIVDILDKFTEFNNTLEAELEARKKQYEFYRDNLLKFDSQRERERERERERDALRQHSGSARKCGGIGGDEIKWLTIKEVCKNICSGGTPNSKNESYYGGDIPWLRTQEIDFCEINHTDLTITDLGLKNSSAKWVHENSVIVAMYGATVGKVAYTSIPLTTNQACCNLEIDDSKVVFKYVYYWLASKYEYIKSLGQGSQTNINAQIVKEILLPVPPLPVQERIVSILDRFDKLCNDITEGLPAEIEARRKQYEYYRDKLLTFTPVSK